MFCMWIQECEISGFSFKGTRGRSLKTLEHRKEDEERGSGEVKGRRQTSVGSLVLRKEEVRVVRTREIVVGLKVQITPDGFGQGRSRGGSPVESKLHTFRFVCLRSFTSESLLRCFNSISLFSLCLVCTTLKRLLSATSHPRTTQ